MDRSIDGCVGNLGPDLLIDGCQRDMHGVTFANEHAWLSPGSDNADDEDALREQQAHNDPALAKLGQGASPNHAPGTLAVCCQTWLYLCAFLVFGIRILHFSLASPTQTIAPPLPLHNLLPHRRARGTRAGRSWEAHRFDRIARQDQPPWGGAHALRLMSVTVKK